MNREPVVSVIIPVYNVEEYLRECLDSVINQTYQNLEIILINDGSTDASLKICQEYVAIDERIKLIDKPNGGLSSARNAGLDIATGEFVSFIDSDDWVELDYYASLLPLLLENEGLSAVYSGLYPEYPESPPVSLSKGSNGESEVYNSISLLEGMNGSMEFAVCAPCYIWRRSALGNMRFMEGLLHEDEFFLLQFLCSNTDALVSLSKDIFYHYRQRSMSITSTFTERNAKSIIEGFDRVYNSLPSHTSDQIRYLCNTRIIHIYIWATERALTSNPSCADLFVKPLRERIQYPYDQSVVPTGKARMLFGPYAHVYIWSRRLKSSLGRLIKCVGH